MKNIIATLLIALAISVSAQERTSALKDLSNVDPATGRTALDVYSKAESDALTPEVDNAAVNSAIASDPANTRVALQLEGIPTNYSIDIAGVNYTADAPGPGGANITITHIESGNGTSVISVVVAGNAITVTAGTETTNSAVATAVNANGSAAAMVTAAALGSSTQKFTAKTATALTSPWTKLGGAGKVLQVNDNGQVVTGSLYAQNSGTMSGAGNILIPDLQGIRWFKRDGTISNAGLYMWQLHDAFGGELIMQSPWRIALIPAGPIQVFANDATRAPRAMTLGSGGAAASPAALNSMPSGVLELMTEVWDGDSSEENKIAFQALPLDSTGNASTLKLFDAATTGGYDGGGLGTDAATGLVTGTEIAEFRAEGFWSNGTAPAFESLAPASGAVTQTCSKYKTVQVAKFTLSEDTTLTIDDAEAGMRGVLYVKQGGGSGAPHNLTLPNGSSKSSTFALSTTDFQVDRLTWEFDGTYYYWTIDNGIELAIDSDAQSFITATGATATNAINEWVLGLKAMGIWSTSVCWPMRSAQNHGSGTTLRSLGGLGSYNGTLVNGPTWSASGIVFDGTNDYISLSNPAQNTALSGITMFSAFDSDGGTGAKFVFGGFQNSSTGAGPTMWVDGSVYNGSLADYSIITLSLDGTNTNTTETGTLNGDTNVMQTFALTANASEILQYSNSSSISRTPVRASYWNNNSTWHMGVRNNAGVFSAYFVGTQAFNFVSTTKLTSTQMAELRTLYKNTLGAGLSLP
jgi:hypothetical protein